MEEIMDELKNILIENYAQKTGVTLEEAKIQLESIIRENLHSIDEEKKFDDFLDEVCGWATIANFHYQASRALKLVDPIMYRQELLNYFDHVRRDPSEMENYYELDDVLYNLADVNSLIENLG